MVLVGGSGLYVEAILKGFDDFPEIETSVREEVTSKYEKLGIEYLQTELEKRDPNYFEVVATENPQRMMRALEVCIGSGKPYSSFLNQKKNTRNFTPILIGLEAERSVIYDRINQRVDIMMNEGLLAEAEKLFSHKNLNACKPLVIGNYLVILRPKYPWNLPSKKSKKTRADLPNDNTLGSKEMKTQNGLII